jgi:alanine-glyoxylate transaminase / (R)-3-amino-2-methylpropionate-pyruvate transaminase
VSIPRVEKAVSKKGATMIQRHGRRLFPWVKPYYSDPLMLKEGKGVWVIDESGREYLDFFAGIVTTSVGHCHPHVVRRTSEQMNRLGHTSALYVTEQQVEVAETLTELAPGALSRTAFTNSGTEANETAIMAARIATGRSEIVALRHAYSGRSTLATGLTAHAPWRPLPTSVPGIVHARSPYPYRSPLGDEASEEEQTDFFVSDLVEVIETTTSGKPAALILEPIQGVGGFIVPPSGYLRRAAEVIRSYGGLLIVDEVQTGFGRTGDQWFGCEHSDVEPDIMVMAKGIANGFPVGATMATDEVAEAWTSLSISTFGGNPVAMAAAGATLEVMIEEQVPARAAERGEQLRSALHELEGLYAWIGEARGMGLMQALEIVSPDGSRAPDPVRARALLEAARKEGLLIGLGGLKGHVVRLGSSLLITEDEVREAVVRLSRACESVA